MTLIEFLQGLGDSSVNIQVLVWRLRDDWSQAHLILLTVIKRALNKSGIEIPFTLHMLFGMQRDSLCCFFD